MTSRVAGTGTVALCLVVILGLGACGADSQETDVTSQQSACKLSAAPAADPGSGTISASAQGDVVFVTHVDAHYNCASKLVLDGSVSGDEILVQEVITNPDEKARCTCYMDLSAQIKGVADGSYTVKVHDTEGKLVGTAPVQVGSVAPAFVFSVGQTLQSDCKPESKEDGYGAGAGQIKVTVSGSSATIRHEDALANCASKLKMNASLTGATIEVQEVITNPGELAYCVCNFDLEVIVSNLAPGSYTVKVFDPDGNLVDSVSITVGSQPV